MKLLWFKFYYSFKMHLTNDTNAPKTSTSTATWPARFPRSHRWCPCHAGQTAVCSTSRTPAHRSRPFAQLNMSNGIDDIFQWTTFIRSTFSIQFQTLWLCVILKLWIKKNLDQNQNKSFCWNDEILMLLLVEEDCYLSNKTWLETLYSAVAI